MDDLDDLDFSFSCNKCSYSTKSIVEIKIHAMEHKKKEANQTENDKGSSKNDNTSSDAIHGDDQAMVDIPVGSSDEIQGDDQEMVDIPVGSHDAIQGDDQAMVDIPVGSSDAIQGDDQAMVDIPVGSSDAIPGDDDADTAMVDIPVGKLDDGNDASGLRAFGNDKTAENEETRAPSGVQETGAQVDSATQSVSFIASTGENQNQDQGDVDKINQDTQAATSNVKTETNEPLNAAEAEAAFVDLLMVDMGTQMSPMPEMPTPRGRGRPKGSTGAAKRKANVPVREQIEEPEEFEESTEDEETEMKDDEDYEPPVSDRALDNIKVGAKRKRGRPPLTRSKLKAKKKTIKGVVPKKKYKCPTCDFNCEVKSDMSSHMKEVHEIEVKIEELSDESDNENNLVEGMLPPQRPLASSIPDDRYSCNVCQEYKCKFKKDLARHKHEAHNIATVEYKYQSRVANDRYKCTHCNYMCKFQRQLRNHRRRAHPRPKPVARSKISSGGVRIRKPKPRVPLDRYKCPESECDFTCKFKGTMKTHKMEKHRKVQQPRIKGSKIKQLECEDCGKLIRGTQHHLLRHMKTHTGEKPYECDICGRVFAEMGRLNIHKPIHNEERPFLCEECGKSFKRKINLRMHRKIHVEVKPHQCELCAYRCNRHDTLNLHMKRKHLKLRRVLCTYCGRKFFSEKECQAHAQRKHLPRPTPFQCTLCPAAFPFAYNLRAHMKKHPEHKPHKCEYCGFESRSKASLKDHVRQHTDGAISDPNDPKPYKCGWCEFASKSQYYIKEHERQHTGEKEKKCDLCDYATTTSSNLYKHRKRQHGIIGMPARQLKGRGRPPRANALLKDGGSSTATVSNVPRQHHPMHPVTITIQPEDLVTHRPHHQSEEERAAEAIEDSATEVVQIPLHMYNKRPGTVMYTQRDKIIGSVITDALAEARNVVQTQSDIYATQMLPTTHPTSSISTSGLTASSALHSSNTLTMAHTAGLPHGTVVNIPEGMISAAGIPVTAQGIHIPVTVAMQNMQPAGPASMFNMMHYP